MKIEDFMTEISEVWPGKGLSIKQDALYRAKLYRFSDSDISKIFEWLTENAKFFPKIPDIFEAARHCAIMDKPKDYQPHEWTPNECRLCGGSGQLAVFYEQLFDPANGKRDLRLQRIMQYQSSEATARTKDWTRYYYRCSCPRGDVPTLDKGLPRWSGEQRECLQLAL